MSVCLHVGRGLSRLEACNQVIRGGVTNTLFANSSRDNSEGLGKRSALNRSLLKNPRPKVFYGWWVLLALCAISFYVAGTFWWGFSVFIPAILDEFGWSRSQISLALTFQGIEGVGVAPIVGLLVDKVGPRRLMLFGLYVAGLGIILLSFSNSLWWFYLAFIVISIGTSVGTGLVSQSLVIRWFTRRRGVAVTGLMVMPGLGALLIIPVLNFSIEAIGWRETLRLIGVGLWIIATPVLLVLRNSPQSLNLEPDGGPIHPTAEVALRHGGYLLDDERMITLRRALGMPTFWLLTAAYTLWNLGSSGVQPHLFVALLGVGMARPNATAVAALLPGVSLAGRLSFGLLSDIVDNRYLLLAAGASMAVGLGCLAGFMLSPSLTWLVFPFLLFYSIGFGGSIPLRVVISGQYFGRSNFPAIYGVLQAFTATGGVVGPLFAGWIFDTTGSYFIAFASGAILMATSLPLVLLARNPQKQSATEKVEVV